MAASSLVFMLMLLAHHDAIPCSRRRQRIDELTFLVPFDLIDASDLLGALTIPTAHGEMPVWAAWWVLGIACFNLLMPTLPLMALSRTQFGAHQLPEVGSTPCLSCLADFSQMNGLLPGCFHMQPICLISAISFSDVQYFLN